MEENTNNTQHNEIDYAGIKARADAAANVVPDFVADANEIIGEDGKVTGVDGFKSIKGIMDESAKEVTNMKFEQYMKDKELPEETKIEDLTPEQLKEMEAIELPDDVLLPMARADENKMFGIYKERYVVLTKAIGNKKDINNPENADGKNLGELNEDVRILTEELESRQNQIKELKEKRDALPKFIEDENGEQKPNPEYDEYNEQIETLNDEVGRIKPLLHRSTDVRDTCVHAMGLQDKIKENMEKALVATYGEKIAKQVLDERRKDEQAQENANKNQNRVEDNKPERQSQQQANSSNAKPKAFDFNEEVPEDPKQAEETNKMFEQLGINKDAELTPELAMGLLKKYSSKDISDEDKLKMFQNSDVKAKIQNAIDTANANKKGHPLFSLKYMKVRRDLTKLMDSTLPKQFLKENKDLLAKFGMKDIDENAIVGLERAKNTLQAQLDGPNLSPEDRKSLEEQMAKLNDVSNFRNGNADVKLMTRRVMDSVKQFTAKNITHRDAYAKQLPAAMEVKEEPTVNEDRKSWEGLTQDEKQIQENDVSKEEKLQNLSKEELEALNKEQKGNQEQQIGD